MVTMAVQSCEYTKKKSSIVHVKIAKYMACELHLNKTAQDFRGGPVVRTPCFHTETERVQPLVRELGSYMPCGTDKNNKKQKK